MFRLGRRRRAATTVLRLHGTARALVFSYLKILCVLADFQHSDGGVEITKVLGLNVSRVAEKSREMGGKTRTGEESKRRGVGRSGETYRKKGAEGMENYLCGGDLEMLRSQPFIERVEWRLFGGRVEVGWEQVVLGARGRRGSFRPRCSHGLPTQRQSSLFIRKISP